MHIDFNYCSDGNITEIKMKGELIGEETDYIMNRIEGSQSEKPWNLHLHMNEVSLIGSEGLRLLVNLKSRCDQTGGYLKIICPSPIVEKALQVCKFSNIIEICSSDPIE